jgi:flagellar motor switch protein FliN
MANDEKANLVHLGDMDVEVVVEMGRKRVSLGEARSLLEGSVIALDSLTGERFDIKINGACFGEGEAVVVHDRMACRITLMTEPVERRINL